MNSGKPIRLTQGKPRILILSTVYLPLIGGSELAIKEVTDRIGTFDFDLITARWHKSLPAFEKIGNVNVYRIGGTLGFKNHIVPKLFLPISIFKKARELLKNGQKYQLIHVFQASYAGGASWLLKFFHPNLPVLLTLQEGKDLETQKFLIKFSRRLIIKNSNQATAISRYLKQYLGGIKNNLAVSLVPNGVDLDNFSREFSYGELFELREKLGLKPGERVITSVSRLTHKNGLDDLVRAAELLRFDHELPEHKVLLIGEGEQKPMLASLAHKLRIRDRVIFAGPVGHGDLPRYLKISDVFIRPSRSEGLGTAFLEAMAAGTPVVATPVGGITDFLHNGKTGIFCRPNDPQSIASKIKALLVNQELRERLSANARALVHEHYNWNKISEEYEKIYQKLSK